MKKFVLLNFSSDLSKDLMPPLGLGYIGAVTKKNNLAKVFFKDFSFYDDEVKVFKSYLSKFNPNESIIFGFSMNTHNRYIIQLASRIIKKKFKNSIIICGGPHITLTPFDTMNNCLDIDFAVIGEGEETIIELLTKINNLENDFEKVNGICFRKDNKLVLNQKRIRIKELDFIPFSDRTILDIKKYPHIHIPGTNPKKVKGTNMIGSRGCPYQCVFCSVADQWGRMTTYRSPQNIIDEIIYLNKEFGYNGIYFFDDTFTLMRKRVIEFCELMISTGLNKKISWFCEARANTLDYDLLKIMKEAGCKSMAMGVESSNQWLLDNIIKKGITIEQVLNVIDWANELGIKLKCFFTIGHPEETYSMALETLKFRDKIKIENKAIGFLKIYPGTPLFNKAIEYNLIERDFSWFKNYKNLEWVSFDKNLGKPIVPLFRHKLSKEDYAKLTAYLYKDKSSISLIFRHLKRIKDIKSFVKYSKLGFIFLFNKISFSIKK